MGPRFSRRRFLGMSFLSLVVPRPALGVETQPMVRAYEGHLSILFNLFTYTLTGKVTVDVDRIAGRYRVAMDGSGPGLTARSRSRGIIQEGRFMPTETWSLHTVGGRENRLSLSYDYERRTVSYHVVAYTLLLGRRRQVDDVVRFVPGQHVDDLISALMNFANDALDVEPDGTCRVTVVRRVRAANEGPDDVSPSGYRAELSTTRFRAAPDPTTGRLTALVDLTGFSSWARPSRPARVVFGPDRYLESVRSSLILGTTFTLHLVPGS